MIVITTDSGHVYEFDGADVRINGTPARACETIELVGLHVLLSFIGGGEHISDSIVTALMPAPDGEPQDHVRRYQLADGSEHEASRILSDELHAALTRKPPAPAAPISAGPAPMRTRSSRPN